MFPFHSCFFPQGIKQWRIQGGSLRQLPPKRLWRPSEWRPFLVPMEVEAEINKYSKISNVSRCVRIYVPEFTRPLIE